MPALTDVEAWQRLPRTEKGTGQPLPLWARTLVATLPHTTAAMLELDYLHRTGNALDPRLRGRLRWVAARTNQCAYSEAYAAADLRRVGLNGADIRALGGNPAGLSEAERAALAFARKVTLAAHTVTDGEMARLIELYGEKQVVAMVLLLAHASFQDRLILALDLPLEPDGPRQPVEVRFAPLPLGTSRAAPRPKPELAPAPATVQRIADEDWHTLDFNRLRKEIAKQRTRKPRIPLPADRPAEIYWGFVCRKYQPELAAAWSACTRAFGEEANQDRIVEASLFWVITRTVQNFY
jgi:alkylhydroperoxidase family enzyme